MPKKRRQQRFKNGIDRLAVIVSEETGNRIRENADKQGLSISNFIASAVEEKLEKIEGDNQQ